MNIEHVSPGAAEPTPTPGEGQAPPHRPQDSHRAWVPQTRPKGTSSAGVTGPIRQFLGPITGSLRLGLSRSDPATEQQLRVDWPQCKAHGLCAEIAPEVIHLDEWGYPVFDPGALCAADLATVRKAVQVCPTLALRLTDVPPRTVPG